MNRRVLLVVVGVVGVICLIVGVNRIFGGGAARQAEQKKVQEQPDQRVVVAVVDIPPGRKIEPEMLDVTKLVTASEKAEKYAGALLDPEKIVGGETLAAIAKDTPIKASQLKPPPDSVSQKVNSGYVAITVAAPEKPSLYDLKFLKPDDHVDVMGVTYDDKGSWTTSTPLVTDARVLAVDVVWDKFKEEMRRKRVLADIDALQKQKQEKMAAPGATPDATKAIDEEIKAKREELDPKYENPSVTVEVTPEKAQLLALWRTSPRTTLKVALHSPTDAAGTILGAETLAAPLSAAPAGTTVTPPKPAATRLASAGGGMPTVLSMDDVVPLIQRDPRQYAELLDIQKNIAETRLQADLRQSQVALERARNTVQTRNWLRYGQEPPPVALTGPGNLPPLVVPRTAGVTEPARQVEKPKPQPPTRYQAPIEVYRGSAVSVVGS